MPRTTAHRTAAHRTAALTASVAGSLLLGLWAATPALAHGAPTDPVSRVFACSPDGGTPSGSAACKAGVAANGAPFTAWDNLRVANVNGRDRQTIPDGKLCSGGLPAYKGLDLARSDWPSTRLTPGGTLTMRYVSTIPHTGTFKLYLTKPGYDPEQPLTWADLPEKPFATVTDPALTDGAYRISAKLPADRTGRQMLYTIWQNTSTPDTYYSCSDVVFPTAKKAGTGAGSASASADSDRDRKSASPSTPAASASASAKKSTAPASPSASASHAAGAHAEAGAGPESTPVASSGDSGSGPATPLLAGGAAAVLVVTGGAALALRLRRR